MKTRIFKNYDDFLINREDEKENGVSEKFAKMNPNWESDNSTNEGCWNCRSCSDCSSCSACSSCRDCSYCSSCSSCSYCRYCSEKQNEGDQSKIFSESKIPVIENIHQKVLQAATATPESLNMADWHTCETTHCRAGWVVFLAGEAGRKLEEITDTCFAAQMIYKKSSDIHVGVNMFFVDNETSINDMKRCAQEEMEAAL